MPTKRSNSDTCDSLGVLLVHRWSCFVLFEAEGTLFGGKHSPSRSVLWFVCSFVLGQFSSRTGQITLPRTYRLNLLYTWLAERRRYPCALSYRMYCNMQIPAQVDICDKGIRRRLCVGGECRSNISACTYNTVRPLRACKTCAVGCMLLFEMVNVQGINIRVLVEALDSE